MLSSTGPDIILRAPRDGRVKDPSGIVLNLIFQYKPFLAEKCISSTSVHYHVGNGLFSAILMT